MSVRQDVGLFDQTSFAKFLVQGPDAETVLQHIFANDVAVETGTLVYSAMLNSRGGFQSDLTINRISENAFMIVTSAGSVTRDFTWINTHIPEEARATLTDVSAGYTVLSLSLIHI